MPPKRMTANPARPARHRPGKPAAEEVSSSSSSAEESESEAEPEAQQRQRQGAIPPPKAASFPHTASKITSNLQNVDLNARRAEAAAVEAARLRAEKAARAAAEEGFETEDSGESESGSESEDEGSTSVSDEEDESSSEDGATARKHLRPVFLKKGQRNVNAHGSAPGLVAAKTEDGKWAEDAARRRVKADALVQEQLERVAAERAAGKKQWDDEDNLAALGDIDDTDGQDPEAEYAAWKLRELRRVKREREAIEKAERERDEIDRRRNLTQDERDAEDRDFIDRQRQEHAGRGQMRIMQKYFHKGAFFQDDAKATGLDRRDIMGSRYVDDARNKDALPEYMQIRDMTRLGRKGRTRYKDMKSEDTGRWGEYGGQRGNYGDSYKGVDDRFRPDREMEGRAGATGANASVVGERKRHGGDSHDREGKRPRIADLDTTTARP